MTDNNYMVFDTDFYNAMQKHFKNDLNGDEFLFNWYCEMRNKLIKEIDKKNIKGIEVDVRNKDCMYITIGKWVIYIDNSTNEKIIDTWENK